MSPSTRYIALPLAIVLAACATEEAPGEGQDVAPAAEPATAEAELQDLIELPSDFSPEGIAIGEDDTFYVGSLAPPNVGQILAGDLRTGEYRELVAATGTPAPGLKHDSRTNLLFVAGGGSGTGNVYDAATGAEVASFEFTAEGSTINDVELTSDAAYFTNSQAPELYRVALGSDGQPGEVSTIELPAIFGEGGSCPDLPAIGGNGIAATEDGRFLILVHMSEGRLYRIDAATQEVTPIELSGGDVCAADGLLLEGQTLYAVQNFLNRVAVVELGADYQTGTVERHIEEPFASNDALAIPTTIADAGDALYAVTAGFAPPSPDYVVRVEK